MKLAAESCVQALLKRWPKPGTVAVLCGSGNNAGDGFIIAGLLKARGIDACIALVGREPDSKSDAGSAYKFCLANGVESKKAVVAIEQSNFLIDALLGTGVTGPVRPDYASVIRQANASVCPILAVDLPSGLSADTGVSEGPCIRADVTVTFIGRKFGLMTGDGPEQAGEVIYADLGVPGDVFEKIGVLAETLDYDEQIKCLKPRHRNAHKVSHGHVLVIGGDTGMAGAALLASEAALYSGAGMVSVATRTENTTAIISRCPEVMARGTDAPEELEKLLARASVLVLGPGLGHSEWSQSVFERALASDLPVVLDADGLNLLAESPRRRENWILTPHPGEAGRLMDAREKTAKPVQEDRYAAVTAMQTAYGGCVLLKGAGTLIATADQIHLCPYGNPGMSVAGMGDLLAGTIGGLLAQGLDISEASKLGATIHSLAADQVVECQGERGLLATELLPVIRKLVNKK